MVANVRRGFFILLQLKDRVMKRLLKLFLKLLKLPAQILDLRAELRHALFKNFDSVGIMGTSGGGTGARSNFIAFDFSRQQMRKASILLTCLTRQLDCHWLGIARAPLPRDRPD